MGGVSLHVRTVLLYLRNDLADWVQICYVGWGVTKHMLSTCHGWGGASLHVRTCTPPPSISVSEDPIDQFC